MGGTLATLGAIQARPRSDEMTNADSRRGGWWDWHLFGLWILVNAAAFAVIPLVGGELELLASTAIRNLIHHHRIISILIIAVVGAVVQGTLVGWLQWLVLVRRVPRLQLRTWVIATVVPVFVVWVVVLAPGAIAILGEGGNPLAFFRNGFIQAFVLGPLLGVSQATALRALTSRWAWWFAADVTTYLAGALLHDLGVWLQHARIVPAHVTPYFPVAAMVIHGTWMLWVTAPQAARQARSPQPAASAASSTGTAPPGTSAP